MTRRFFLYPKIVFYLNKLSSSIVLLYFYVIAEIVHISFRSYYGDTRCAYYSIFDRASSRASTRRDASFARTDGSLAGTDDPGQSLSRAIFLLVSILLSSSCFAISLRWDASSQRTEIVPMTIGRIVRYSMCLPLAWTELHDECTMS